MTRPYASLSIEDLEDLLNRRGRDQRIRSLITEELGQRRTKRARKLFSVVAKLMAKSEPTVEENPQLERVLKSDDREPDVSLEVITGGRAPNSGHRGDKRFSAYAEDVPPDDRRRPDPDSHSASWHARTTNVLGSSFEQQRFPRASGKS